MDAAGEVVGRVADLPQHQGGGRQVQRIPAVRTAGQRDLGISEAQVVGCAGGHEGQGLRRLHRRPGKHGALHVAHCEQAAAGRVDDRDAAAVPGFDGCATGDLDKDRIGRRGVLAGVTSGLRGRG